MAHRRALRARVADGRRGLRAADANLLTGAVLGLGTVAELFGQAAMAADAWPLLGLKEGIEKFKEQPIVGEPSLAPRLVTLPVRMPLPPAEYQGSIRENQRASGRRYFVTPKEPARIAAE